MKCEHEEGQQPENCLYCRAQFDLMLNDAVDRSTARSAIELVASRVAKAEIRLALGLLDTSIRAEQGSGNEAWRRYENNKQEH